MATSSPTPFAVFVPTTTPTTLNPTLVPTLQPTLVPALPVLTLRPTLVATLAEIDTNYCSDKSGFARVTCSDWFLPAAGMAFAMVWMFFVLGCLASQVRRCVASVFFVSWEPTPEFGMSLAKALFQARQLSLSQGLQAASCPPQARPLSKYAAERRSRLQPELVLRLCDGF